jgi:hypothetical protein
MMAWPRCHLLFFNRDRSLPLIMNFAPRFRLHIHSFVRHRTLLEFVTHYLLIRSKIYSHSPEAHKTILHIRSIVHAWTTHSLGTIGSEKHYFKHLTSDTDTIISTRPCGLHLDSSWRLWPSPPTMSSQRNKHQF